MDWRLAGPAKKSATLKARNPLKSPISDEKFQEIPNKSKARIQGKKKKGGPKSGVSKRFQIGERHRDLPSYRTSNVVNKSL
jgi:hypothetical protein